MITSTGQNSILQLHSCVINCINGGLNGFHRDLDSPENQLYDLPPLIRNDDKYLTDGLEKIEIHPTLSEHYQFIVGFPSHYKDETISYFKNIIVDFFNRFNARISIYFDSETNVNNIQSTSLSENVMFNVVNKMWGNFSLQQFSLPDDFNEEEKTLLPFNMQNISERALDFKPRSLSCYLFAFLKKREIALRESFYQHSFHPSCYLIALKKWGYEVTQTPEANDLVIYIKDGFPTHTALYLGGGFALSKPGNKSPYVMKHPVTIMYPDYGPHFVFYHKTGNGVFTDVDGCEKITPK